MRPNILKACATVLSTLWWKQSLESNRAPGPLTHWGRPIGVTPYSYLKEILIILRVKEKNVVPAAWAIPTCLDEKLVESEQSYTAKV